jgi:biotin synthase
LIISEKMETINRLKEKVFAGGEITYEEGVSLIKTNHREALFEASAEITRKFCTREFDSCSIVNVRSGKCSENCKWCAQSAHYNTGCHAYELMGRDECIESARYNHERGIKRLSLVASGRSLGRRALDEVCGILRDIKNNVGISTCASLGLLSRDELQKLYDSGVRRYHCNLETAPSYFAKLCTTHTIDDKIKTIETAHELGFEVCSGGIIGMGESAEQRVELGVKLREAKPLSIPINILSPIPGTPLADVAPIGDDEILVTVAVFRFLHPRTQLRFAGGRGRLSRETQLKCLTIGVNGGIVGDLLTTIGSQIDEDRCLVEEAGYRF